MGKIDFTETCSNGEPLPRAGVELDGNNSCLRFMFNPKYYVEIDSYELAFILGHECMHLILMHGKRLHSNPNYVLNPQVFNIAADITLHEIMFDEFGFDRTKVTENLCTVETIFKDQNVKRLESLDYYFDQLKQEAERSGNIQYVIYDTHNFNSKDCDRIQNIVKRAISKISDVEYEELKRKLDKELPNKGDEQGGNWYHIKRETVKKQKWEMVFKEWSQAFLQSDKFDWSRKGRRFHGITGDMILPSTLELDIKRVKVWLFMDTSGSCIKLASRFFNAAASLPKKFFDVKLFCFDTQIYETNINAREVKGGGGTSFQIIDEYVKKRANNHPDFVFMITDGYGDAIKPANPRKWHIFLTSENKEMFPKECVFHSFTEFQ